MSKKNQLISVAAALLAIAGTGAVHAEQNHFAGPYVVVTNEWKNASATVDGEKIKKSESAPSIALGYTLGLDAHSTLGFKVAFDTKNGEYGVGDVGGKETEVKEKSHYSIAVEPGYAINDKVLVFGILAYHKAKAELVNVTDETSSTRGISGYGYGVGAKYSLSHHFFLMAELQKVSYRSKAIDPASSVKPSSNVLALGVGYHF
ncbi:MAG: porin family protein [Limnohabitans sp.]